MSKIRNKADLEIAIFELEGRQKTEWILLKKQVQDSYENINPLDFLKKSFKWLNPAGEQNNNLVSGTIGIAVSYLTKAILIGSSKNPIKIFLVNILQIAISNLIAQNPAISDAITKFVMDLMDKKIEVIKDDGHSS